MNNQKALFATVLATVGFLLLSAPAIYADISLERNNLTVSGNCTNNKLEGNYTYWYINATQLNTTTYSNQNVWYEIWLNVSVNATGGAADWIPAACTVTGLNFTLPETWALNTTSSVRLVNRTGTLVMNAANSTGVNPVNSQLGLLYFNLTGRSINGSQYATGAINNVSVTNTSNTTFRIQFEITSLNSHKTEVTTSSGLVRTYNVTLPAPSNMSMSMVKVRGTPTGFASANVWNSVIFNGTTLSTAESALNRYLITGTDMIFLNNTNFTAAYNHTWAYVSFSVSESGHGDGGDGTITTLPITMPSLFDATTFIAAAVTILAVLAALAIIYFKYK